MKKRLNLLQYFSKKNSRSRGQCLGEMTHRCRCEQFDSSSDQNCVKNESS